MTRRQVLESALGLLPLPAAVSMLGECPESGFTLASGVLESAEPIDGEYYHIADVVVMAKADTAYPLRIMAGKQVKLILREIPQRPELEKLKR